MSSWGLFALLVVCLLLAATIFGYLGGARTRAGSIAIALFLGYTSWTFLSLLWSANRGDAWYGSSLTLMYLVLFWVSATLVALGASRRFTLAAFAVGPGVIALVITTMLASPSATEGGEFFLGGRLMGPTGYFNAQAAFLLASFWAGIYVSGSRRINPLVRGITLASSVLCLQVSALTQSRGAALAFVASAIVFFLFSGKRMRGFLAFAPVAVCSVLAFPTLNEVYLQLVGSENIGRDGFAALSGAQDVIFISGAVVALYGVAWGLIERSWRPPANVVKFSKVACLVAVVAILVGGSAVLASRYGSPVDLVEERWVAFKTDDSSGQSDSRFLSASGSGRFILWEVAWRDFEAAPITGVGTHNYESTYYQYRDGITSWVRQPHSLPLEVLAERGIVGGLLFFGFLGVCVGVGLYKRFSQLNSEGKGQAGAIFACITYWFTHSSAEWFWQVPATTVPAIVFLAMMVVPWQRMQEEETVFWPLYRPMRLAGFGIAVLAFVTITPLFVANHYLQLSQSRDNPWQSLQDLERAQRFDPLDADLARTEADLAYQIGDIPLATQSYARAIELNPDNYANYSVLAGVYEQLGQTDKALELYEQSLELNKLDPALQDSVTRLEQASSDP